MIQEENRQMPSTEVFLKDINIIDLVYGYYQMKAYRDTKTNQMYCYQSDVANNTIYTYFKDRSNPKIGKKKIETAINLINGLYVEREDKKNGRKIYVLKTLERNESIEVRYATLGYLLANCNGNILKIYIYLKMKYMFHQMYHCEEDYCFSINELILMLGYQESSCHTQSIRTMVQLNLSHLVQMELIEYEDIIKVINGSGVPYKRLLIVRDCVKEVDSFTKRWNENTDIVSIDTDAIPSPQLEDVKKTYCVEMF